MTLNISEDILTAQNTLLRQSNGRQIQEYMDKNNYGDQTPVDTSFLRMDNDRKIIITDEIQEKLDVINEVCKTDGGEIPYFLTGTKLEDGTIRFDKIIISYGSMEQQSASFSKESVEQMNQFVTDNKDNQNAIVCHGHTHPQHGSFHNQFSIDDLGAYVNFKNNQEFGQVDTIGMVLVDGSYNFIDYNKNEFYKIKNVFHEIEKNQKYELLPSYSHEKVNERQNIDNANLKEGQTQQNEYVQRFSNGWDETFNKIVEQSGNDKSYIKQEMINQADALNNTIYKLQCEGKITEQQTEQIYGNFNISFNQAFKDFELSPLTEEEQQQIVHSMNYTKGKVEEGMSIEQIDETLNSTTAKYTQEHQSQGQAPSQQSLVKYKKEPFWKKIVIKVKEFYNNMKPNKGEVKQRTSQVGINECGEIIREGKESEFFESLKSEIVTDIPQFVPPNSNKQRDISIQDFQDKER